MFSQPMIDETLIQHPKTAPMELKLNNNQKFVNRRGWQTAHSQETPVGILTFNAANCKR